MIDTMKNTQDMMAEWDKMLAAYNVLASGQGHIERVRVYGKYKNMTVEGPRKPKNRPAVNHPFYFLKR